MKLIINSTNIQSVKSCITNKIKSHQEEILKLNDELINNPKAYTEEKYRLELNLLIEHQTLVENFNDELTSMFNAHGKDWWKNFFQTPKSNADRERRKEIEQQTIELNNKYNYYPNLESNLGTFINYVRAGINNRFTTTYMKKTVEDKIKDQNNHIQQLLSIQSKLVEGLILEEYELNYIEFKYQ